MTNKHDSVSLVFGITFFTTVPHLPCYLLILIWPGECGKNFCLKVFDHKNPITVTMFKMSEPLILLDTVTDCLSAYSYNLWKLLLLFSTCHPIV